MLGLLAFLFLTLTFLGGVVAADGQELGNSSFPIWVPNLNGLLLMGFGLLGLIITASIFVGTLL